MIANEFDLEDGFYLDGWLVEPQLGRVARNEQVRQLEPKIMAVLVLLASNQLAVVRKEVFLDTVWHDVNVIDHVLSRAISEIRGAFDDDPRNPRVIQTLPKIGYILLKPVSPRTRKAPPTHTNQTPISHERRHLNSRTLAFFLGGALMVTTAILSIGILFVLSGRHGH